MRSPLRLGLALLAVCAARSEAQPADALASRLDADPMELARLVDWLGDDAVLERLAEDRPRDVRLAAVRAAPWTGAPERTLEPLAAIAAGRDPDLAPAAAGAALEVALALDPADLARREADRGSLKAARARLSAIGADAGARPDIRAAARWASHAIAELFPQPPDDERIE